MINAWMARCAAAAAALLIGLGLGTPARAAETGLGLELTAGSSRVSPGDELPLEVTVVNRGPTECRVAALSSGTVRVLSLTRDGKPVTPQYSVAAYTVSLAGQANAAAVSLAPGSRASFPMHAVSTVDALPGGGGLRTTWPIDATGDYRLQVRYVTPPSLGGQACAEAAEPATVEFTVSEPVALVWWLVGGGVLLIALGVGGYWLLRRRKAAGTGAGVLVLVCLVTTVTWVQKPAHAEITTPEFTDTLYISKLNGCLDGFRKPGSDPAGLMPLLDPKPGRPPVIVRPWLYGVNIDGFDGKATTPDAGAPIVTDLTVYWNPTAKYNLEPGVDSDPCAELYHELAHAAEFKANGKLDSTACASERQTKSEVAATVWENRYRATRTNPKLPQRTMYDDRPLPTSFDQCKGKPAKSGNGRACVLKECDPDTPSGPGGGGGDSGSSNGDPHLVTLDGRRYSLQTVGEYVLVGSDTGDLAVQARQSPVPHSVTASLNSAFAFQVGKDRLQLAMVRGKLALWVNGKPESWDRGSRVLPGGGKAARRESTVPFNPDGYTIRWQDGSLAWVDPVGLYGLRVQLQPAAARFGKLHGLLGDFDKNRSDDITPRNGTPLVSTTDFEQLYHVFGDSWRVSQGESLFVYGPGESTETFTDRSFPKQLIGLADLDRQQRENAAFLCANAGVTDPELLADCVFDVALTGEAAFAGTGARLQELHDSSTAETPSTSDVPLWTGGPVGDGARVGGELTDSKTPARYDLDLGGAQEFLVGDWHGTTDRCDQTFTVDIVGIGGGHFPCTGQSVRFRVPDKAAKYQLAVASTAGGVGRFSFTLITVKRRVIPITLETPTAGTLDVRGREDQLEFDAAGVRGLTLSGLPSCEAGILVSLIDVTAGQVVSGDRPLCEPWLFPYTLDHPTHRYALVISNSAAQTGPYSLVAERTG